MWPPGTPARRGDGQGEAEQALLGKALDRAEQGAGPGQAVQGPAPGPDGVGTARPPARPNPGPARPDLATDVVGDEWCERPV